jgi:hypothetical protein
VKNISFLPHLLQVWFVTASVLRSSADKVWTAERLDLKEEGKAEGLDSETIVCGMMSENMLGYYDLRMKLPSMALFGSHTLVPRSANIAVQDRIFISGGLAQ